MFYGDFESILKLEADNENDGPNTKKYQYHSACSYGYKLICFDEE